MTNNEIINILAKNKIVEQIVYQINRKEQKQNLQDLVQDIYLDLLKKDNKKLTKMYEKNELNFFIANMVLNQICSKTSNFHKKYRLYDAYE